MSIVFVLLPLSLLLALTALVGYLWGVRKGQFDDLDTPAMRILFDDQDEERTAAATAPPPVPKPELSPEACEVPTPSRTTKVR